MGVYALQQMGHAPRSTRMDIKKIGGWEYWFLYSKTHQNQGIHLGFRFFRLELGTLRDLSAFALPTGGPADPIFGRFKSPHMVRSCLFLSHL
jgi:hypothetical protein